MSDEPRSAIYAIRWEILLMSITLVLIALAIYFIPNNFSDKLLKEREALKIAEQNINITNTTSTQP
ncbi:MAG: hypothetical protein QW416_03620 [Candidatus Nitrosocaldaceae archaeon]